MVEAAVNQPLQAFQQVRPQQPLQRAARDDRQARQRRRSALAALWLGLTASSGAQSTLAQEPAAFPGAETLLSAPLQQVEIGSTCAPKSTQ
jgi:hypothetical protein